MDEIKQADTNATPAVAEDKKIETPQEPSQNPLEAELTKIKEKGEGRTKLEKLIYTKKRVEQQLEEERKALGLEPEPEAPDDAPLTVKMYKEMERAKAARTAEQLADDIEDEKERELVKHHLNNTIRHTGNPREDLRTARMLANAVRSAQIAEELGRKTPPKQFVSGAGAPANYEPEFEPTQEESLMMTMKGLDGKPLLTKEDIIKARKK